MAASRLGDYACVYAALGDFQSQEYGRNLPSSVILTRGPSSLSTLSISRLKVMALMIPSPNSSFVRALMVP